MINENEGAIAGTMNGSIPLELKQKVNNFSREIMAGLAQNAAGYNELVELWQELHAEFLEATAASLRQLAETYGQPNAAQTNVDKIEADTVTVVVVDKNKGGVFRRNFPIEYRETANGVILAGETMEGKPSEIAFFSEFGCAKINDVTGRGADAPRDHDLSE